MSLNKPIQTGPKFAMYISLLLQLILQTSHHAKLITSREQHVHCHVIITCPGSLSWWDEKKEQSLNIICHSNHKNFDLWPSDSNSARLRELEIQVYTILLDKIEKRVIIYMILFSVSGTIASVN